LGNVVANALTPMPEELRTALTAVLSRLSQFHSLWYRALENYFEPKRFLIELQSCITISRTVTFILQSHKSEIPHFDAWYQPYQDRFAANPLMRWAKDARNKIEKQGDLETLSQVRAELIAAYGFHPKTNWVPESIGWSPLQFLKNIPAKFLDAHVIENGVLAIERRWIDVELPDFEVLDALAAVYGQLALMIVSLHNHCRVVIPDHNPKLGEHMLRNLLPDGRTPGMARPYEDRGVYIAIKDGSIVGYRRDFRNLDPSSADKATKRYNGEKFWEELPKASSLLDAAKIYFKTARSVMLRDGYHVSLYVPLKNNRPLDVIVAPPRNRMDKYLIIRDVAHLVRRSGADGLILISEAWTASKDEVPKGQFAADVPSRGESLMLAAVNSAGEQINLSAKVIRKKWRPKKVKELRPTEIEIGTRMVSMAPVLEVWGVLGSLNLDKDDEANRWAENHFRPESE
jgi:hypothetical protein